MHLLTGKIAKEIVKETSLRLHRNVNIMNTEGIIIAALDKSRIGSVHKGALEAVATGKTQVIPAAANQSWEGTQPGVNLPIVFMEEIIGVIGITGDPEEMGNIGELVKMATELMILQEFMDSQMEWKQRTKDTIIDQLLKKEHSIKSMDESLHLLGLTLQPPFTSIIVQIENRSVPNRTLIQQIEEIIGINNGISGFINVNRLFIALYGMSEKEIDSKINAIYHSLKDLNILFRMSYSLPFEKLEKFNRSYDDCEITLEISETEKDLVSFAQIEVKSLFYQVDKNLTEHFSHRILKNFDENKAKTLESFFSNNLTIQKTADELYLHRNTLIYRLKKIIDDTGYDPKNFNDAVNLQAALWIFQKEKRDGNSGE